MVPDRIAAQVGVGQDGDRLTNRLPEPVTERAAEWMNGYSVELLFPFAARSVTG